MFELWFRSEYPQYGRRWAARPSAAAAGQHAACWGCRWTWERWRWVSISVAGSTGCRCCWERHWTLRLPCKAGADPSDLPYRAGQIWTGCVKAHRAHYMLFFSVQNLYYWEILWRPVFIVVQMSFCWLNINHSLICTFMTFLCPWMQWHSVIVNSLSICKMYFLFISLIFK